MVISSKIKAYNAKKQTYLIKILLNVIQPES